MILRSFRIKLLAAFMLLLTLVATPAALVYVGLQQSRRYDERAEAAQNVLDAHQRIAERGQRLLRHVQRAGAVPGDETEQRLRDEIAREISATRTAITTEVELIGLGGANEEAAEFERLEHIRAALDRRAAGEPDTDWRSMLTAAMDEERREVAQLDATERRIFDWLERLLGLAVGAAIAIGAVSLFWLQRSIRRPLERLTAGTRALAGGNLSHRIAPGGDREFAALGRSFNLMAADLSHQTEAVRRSRDELEATVAVRTSALESAYARLAEAADRRRRFLADISHELRTPLTIIRGEAEVTLRATKPRAVEYRSALSRIAEQARGMARLVDDLLFVARTDAGEPKLMLRPLALTPLVEGAVNSVRTLIEADGGRIGFAAPVNSASVNGDKDRLLQLVHVLLDNAMRYSSEAPDIDVELAPSPGGVTVRISDRGIGIPQAELPRVFDRYRRGERAERDGGDGSGLGLPLAKAVVDAHGGAIHVESQEDRGTTVSVFLPASNGLRAVA